MKEGDVDKRGLKTNPKKINNENVVEHVESFHPTISHYRREHAPNVMYLSSDITVPAMYSDYCETHCTDQEKLISYEYYRKIVKDRNISIAKLGHEECELCQKFLIHNPRTDLRHRNCEECKNYEIHHEKYILARAEYQRNVDVQNNMKGKPINAN
ncbi:unnamed protein product [Parnassius apollo]|uniref:(apollo) hypothetical protein n=1 Tax=Parnassius apollo TaxID=110799 RepID=A0A8S3W1I9_PARAO|nr:unnamed protein product [Parnassius apollo]